MSPGGLPPRCGFPDRRCEGRTKEEADKPKKNNGDRWLFGYTAAACGAGIRVFLVDGSGCESFLRHPIVERTLERG